MKQSLGIFFRGMAMGAADLVPGVSGGTVALITGIYDRLLSSIASVDVGLIRCWKEGGIGAVWVRINGAFLLALLCGIGTSVVGLSGVLHHLLEHERMSLYSFFFGLVGASIPLITSEIERWNWKGILGFCFGAALAFSIGSLPPLTVTPSFAYLFACGALAACAMILPGISGSFILLLLGVYSSVIGALKSFDLAIVATVAAGAISGLLGFSKLLKRWLERSRNAIMAVLTGLLLGSLQALWPWKVNALLLYTHSDGRETWLQTNALPEFHDLANGVVFAALGAGLVTGMHFIGQRLKP